MTLNKLTNDIQPLSEVDKINEIIDTVNSINIPSVGNGIVSFTQNGQQKGSFSANQSSNTTIDFDLSSRNIGEIVASTIPLTDAGLHLLDGALIQGSGVYSAFVTYIAGLVSAYPDLFTTESDWQSTVTQYGVCGKFVYNSTNNTVRLPKITGIIEGTTDVTALGNLVEAGLPNITGTLDWVVSYTGGASGAFKLESSNNSNSGSGSNVARDFSFDASRSSSIYGNSTTVQPQTIKVLYYIVVATSAKTDIQVDIDEIATDLNGKADRDLSNTTPAISFATAMNTAGIRTVVETYRNGSSWYRVYSDGWCEQGGQNDIKNSGTAITLLKSYTHDNFALAGSVNARTNWALNQSGNDSIYFRSDSSTTYKITWQACGYIR